MLHLVTSTLFTIREYLLVQLQSENRLGTDDKHVLTGEMHYKLDQSHMTKPGGSLLTY